MVRVIYISTNNVHIYDGFCFTLCTSVDSFCVKYMKVPVFDESKSTKVALIKKILIQLRAFDNIAPKGNIYYVNVVCTFKYNARKIYSTDMAKIARSNSLYK